MAEYRVVYCSKNIDKLKDYQKQYCEKNKEKRNAYAKQWRIFNQEKLNAQTARRRAARIQRTPAWLTDDQRQMIENFYFQAKMLEIETGIKHHVDHIIPLRGKNVSGLHVPENLRVISAKENLTKNNRYEC